MGLNPRGLKTIERHRPTVLPVQRQTSQHSSSTDNTQQGAVHQTVHTPLTRATAWQRVQTTKNLE
jgi:hypothetical protein